MSIYKLTEIWGWLNLPLLVIMMLEPARLVPEGMPYSSVVSTALMQLIVSAAMIYASRQKQAGSEIGHKVYPATLVAYVLWVLMVIRWWG